MKAPQLPTKNADVRLIEPDIERDPELSVHWLEGEVGRQTLRLMGVNDDDNVPSTLEQEQERVRDFLANDKQLNWMIERKGTVVGSVWVDLAENAYLKAPSVHIMIGDPTARGHGVGGSSLRAVIDYLQASGNSTIYSRRIVSNQGSERLLQEAGFTNDGVSYHDGDGLEFQNVVLKSDVVEA